MGNPGFGIHCHPLDSVNPGFIRRTPPVNPLDSFGFTLQGFMKRAKQNLDSEFLSSLRGLPTQDSYACADLMDAVNKFREQASAQESLTSTRSP